MESLDLAVIYITGQLDENRVKTLVAGTRLMQTFAGFPLLDGFFRIKFAKITHCDSFGLELIRALNAHPNVVLDLSNIGDEVKHLVRRTHGVPRRADFPRRTRGWRSVQRVDRMVVKQLV